MILKGGQRANGGDLAVHLMNAFDNEQVELAQVRGTVADDLPGALAEFEAVARGTKAREYLYSLSINPPSPLSREQYLEAIDAIESRLGLSGQPRAIVFHVKDGREHCHVVWSRIDGEKMRAVQLSHDRRRLMDMACILARRYGLKLAPGLEAWEQKRKHSKEYIEATLAERALEKKTGISPDQRRKEITFCYEQADTAEAFRAALSERGYVLAKGDRRGFVVVDAFGDVHSLTRYIKGHKADDVKAKLAAINLSELPGVEQAKAVAAMNENARQAIKEDTGPDPEFLERKAAREAELSRKQKVRRTDAAKAEQEVRTRQQAERLSLHAAHKAQEGSLLHKLRSAVADLIGRTPGLRSVLGPIQKLTHLDPREKQRLEDEALSRRHARELRDVERLKRLHGKLEARERRSLERDLAREQRLAAERKAQHDARREAELADALETGARGMQDEQALRDAMNMATQDFHDAAKDQKLWRKRKFAEGEISVEFNDTAEFVEGADRDDGDDDDDQRPGLDDDAEDNGGWKRSHRPRRGKDMGN